MAQSEKIFVPRFASQRLKDGGRSERQLISHWRDTPAYVLLGDPGAGKTKAMTDEALASGAQVVSASEFGNIGSASRNKGTPVFIDGLDESRARSTDAGAIDAIQKQLDKLNKPRFRLACREIDWLGGADTSVLKAVSPNSEIVELDLEPLTDEDIVALLVNWPNELPDPATFWRYAIERGLQDWLRNPMALELFVKAISRIRSGRLPDSKFKIFELACEQLATEFNDQHLASRRRAQPALDHILDDAGKMFAALLLSNADGLRSTAAAHVGTGVIIVLNTLPSEFAIKNEAATRASLLFTTVNGQSKPYHRTIAEYLGAVAIGKLVTGGLPINRVLSLMSGQDGGIVEPLRGLHAWMAVTCPQARTLLIDRDPLGVVMYGDVRSFSTHEKRQIFEALAREASRYAWFRQGAWSAHPFGALGTRDMVATMQEILGRPARDTPHQSLLRCVFDAINFGDELPDMVATLAAIVENNTFDLRIRNEALEAWLSQSKPKFAPARRWLDEIKNGTLDDPDDELRGSILTALYPTHITPQEVFNYFSAVKKKNFIGGYRHFWSHLLMEQTPQGKFGELADALALMPLEREQLYLDFERVSIFGEVISAALNESSALEKTSRIIEWLRIGRGNYDDVVIRGADAAGIAAWLTAHPDTLKGVYQELCLREAATEPTDRLHFWNVADCLYGAKYPRDWYNWLLKVAAVVESPKLANFYLQRAAAVALETSVDFDVRMEDVEDWVRANNTTWPQAQNWLTEVWSTPLSPSPAWQQNQFNRQREHQTKRLTAQQLRATQFAELFVKYKDGVIGTGALHHLAMAYKGRYSDIRGETPEAGLQDLTGGGTAEVKAAVSHILASLQRTDLPSVKDILVSGVAGEEHLVRPACLIAADLAYTENSVVLTTWPEELLRRLVAFWLTDGSGNEPEWFGAAIQLAPQSVADVMIPYAQQMVRKRPANSITGLWALARKENLADLARIVVPAILEKFPVRANETQLGQLVGELLPAALKHLESEPLTAIMNRRLANTSMDAGQRIAWLAIGTLQNDQASAKALVKFLGRSQSRVQHLIHALSGQVDRDMNHLALSVETQSLLVEILGPNVSPARPNGLHTVRSVDNARELLSNLIATLSSSTDLKAGRALSRLRCLPSLSAWFTSLDGAISDNTRLVRAANFAHASPQKVASTLANKAPANAADLQALVFDQLLQLEREIRGSDANLLHQFWRSDGAGGQQPELENTCRDRLLVLLRSKLLAVDVQVEKESHAFDDKRADLRASHSIDGRRRIVPIEVKQEDEINVWTAWRDQLDKKYLSDPDTGGYGIYLVLWFGRKPKALDGVKPQNAGEMAAMLRGRIPAEDRIRIIVAVMDLSRPR